MSTLLITLCVGLILGYAAQRSRFCLIGGVRDYMIVKDKYLLKGMFALLITAALLFLALHLLGVHQENMKNYPMFIKDTTDQQVIEASACANTKPLYLFLKKAGGLKFNRWGAKLDLSGYCTIAGAFIIGILSVLAGGCPLRQHVKAAGGNKSAIVYLGGFYVGVIVYMLFLNDFFKALFKSKEYKGTAVWPSSVCRKTPGLIRDRSPLWLYSDLATCASERMKTQRFSYFAFGADRAIGASTG